MTENKELRRTRRRIEEDFLFEVWDSNDSPVIIFNNFCDVVGYISDKN